MNFSGFVPFRRGLLEHTQTGKLSTQEFAVFTVLVLLADKETGAGRINAPVLMSWLPDLSYDAAKRALLSLESKGYIFRDIQPYARVMYPYWVNRYVPTSGPHKSLCTSLSKVFHSKDPNDIEYINPALQGAPQGAPQGALNPAPNNKKGQGEGKKINPPTGKDRSAHCVEHSVGAERKPCVPGSAHVDAGDADMCAAMCADAPAPRKSANDPIYLQRLAELRQRSEELRKEL